jgi:hypothetical protein
MLLVDIYVVLDNVQFNKEDFTHRNKIKTQHGSYWLSIPIDKKNSSSKKIKDICICNAFDWQEKHFKNFRENYHGTPYYKEIISILEEYYSSRKIKLVQAVDEMHKILFRYLEITPNIFWASEVEQWNSSKGYLIADIVESFGGTVYISGPNGRQYINEEVREYFRSKCIDIFYHDYYHPVYEQKYGDFLPFMTIWDLLFYKGKETINIIKRGKLNK